MDTPIRLGPRSGGDDGFRGDFPLERDLAEPVVVDATGLGRCHPMFLLRLRLFLDWHVAAGHEVRLVLPTGEVARSQVAEMRVLDGLPERLCEAPVPALRPSGEAVLPLHRLHDYHDVEDAANAAVEVLTQQIPDLATWGDATHMAIGELCDNAIQHGTSDLGAYVAADRTSGERPSFRLAIVDLGIGIPEHIRARYPEWHDDTAAISQVLQRGITGTGDPHRGNGFAEVIDEALGVQMRRASSALRLDIRSARGRLGLRLVDERRIIESDLPTTARRGTWITYEVVTAGP